MSAYSARLPHSSKVVPQMTPAVLVRTNFLAQIVTENLVVVQTNSLSNC